MIRHDVAGKSFMKRDLLIDISGFQVMGREFNASVKTILHIIFIPMRQRRNNEYFPDARFFTTVLTPYGEGFFCVRKMLGAIDQKYRPTFLANIAGIIEHRHKIANEIDVVVGEIFLGNEDLVISSIPAAGPVFIGPAHTKRHVVFGISEHFIKGTVENSLS